MPFVDPADIEPTGSDQPKAKEHTLVGYRMLSGQETVRGDVAETVLQHHEHWNGGGYPRGLRGAQISKLAQIVTLADHYTALLCPRPQQGRFLSHEAIEYLMAYSGEQFNPDLVQLFVRQIPCYSSGLGVVLNTGERGVVVAPNLGVIGRPVVRVCTDRDGRPLPDTFDVDLANHKEQSRLVTAVLEYD
jgi:HD-GYP domain-containing protein (c-di-GMP phosphodiesterase class II)